MARNRPNPLDDPPAASSSEDELLNEEEDKADTEYDGKGSESEDEVPKKTLQQQLPNPTPKSDDQTDSEGSPCLPGFTIYEHVPTSPVLKRPPTSEGKNKSKVDNVQKKMDSRAKKKSKVDNEQKELNKSTIQATHQKNKENVNLEGEYVVSSQLPLKDQAVVSRKLQKGKKTVVPTLNGKDEAVDIQAGKKADASEKRFSKLYPYLCMSLKKTNSDMGLMSKDWVEKMEGSLCQLEKSKLEELEGDWKKQIVGEIVGRNSILLKQIGMVKELHLGRG